MSADAADLYISIWLMQQQNRNINCKGWRVLCRAMDNSFDKYSPTPNYNAQYYMSIHQISKIDIWMKRM